MYNVYNVPVFAKFHFIFFILFLWSFVVEIRIFIEFAYKRTGVYLSYEIDVKYKAWVTNVTC